MKLSLLVRTSRNAILSLALLTQCKENKPDATGATAPGDKAPASQAVPSNEAQWETYTRQADDLAAKNELVDAVAMYREAIKIRSDFTKAHVNLGSALMRLERHGEAAAALEEALRTDPKSAAAHLNLASLMLLDDNADGALPHLEDAAKSTPDLPDVHRNLGLVYMKKLQYVQAVDAYKRLVLLAPKDPNAFADLGLAQLAAGAAGDGIATLRLGADRPEATVRDLQSLAWALATHRDPGVRKGTEAVQYAEKAVAKADEKSMPNALRALGAAQAEKGDAAAGRATLQRALKLVQGKDKAAEEQLDEDIFMLDSSRPIRD